MANGHGLTLNLDELQTATPIAVFMNHEQRIRDNATDLAANNATLTALSKKLDTIITILFTQAIALVVALCGTVVRLATNGGHF